MEKTCRKCGQTKPVEEFPKNRLECRECYRARYRRYWEESPERIKQKNKRWRDKAPYQERKKPSSAMRAVGMSMEQYREIKEAQGHRCAICGTDTPGGKGDFHVDHCHVTGRFRALLCSTCNIGLGSFGDNPELMERAAEYLRAHSSSHG